MHTTPRRTTIVATLGPASNSPEVIRQLIVAGMDVARLNFSHGSYDDHARVVASLRAISAELDTPVTILQDLQGPEDPRGATARRRDRAQARRSGRAGAGSSGDTIPISNTAGNRVMSRIPLDYPHAAEEAKPGAQMLLADGAFELEVLEAAGSALRCRVIEGGVLKSRKGVNFPSLNLRLPSLTEKDKQDLEFGLSQDVDWISLSFVRCGQDVRELKELAGRARRAQARHGQDRETAGHRAPRGNPGGS